MNKVLISLGVVVLIIIIGLSIFFGMTYTGREIWNNYRHGLQQVDDATLYRTRRQVEDTARAMQANYTADVLTWEQYKDSDSKEQQGWASAARMRANRTAATYNEYILKNSYVWEGNIPDDILQELEYLN